MALQTGQGGCGGARPAEPARGFLLSSVLALAIASGCGDARNRPGEGVSLGGGADGGGTRSSGGSGLSAGGAGAGQSDGSAGRGVIAGSGGSGAAAGGSGGAQSGPGGSSGTGGASADGGLDVPSPPTDAAGALEPIRVSGGDSAGATYYDVQFVGAALHEYEGAVVTFRVGSRSGAWPLGSGQVRIVDGGFDVHFPDVVPARYQRKLAHIDANRNSACDLGEPTFVDQGLIDKDITLMVTPDDIRLRPAVAYWCTAVNDWPVP